MPELHFPTPREFAFDAAVVSHGWYHLAPFRWDAANHVLHRTELLGSCAVDLEITHEKGGLIVRSGQDIAPHRTLLAARLERMFQLRLDLEPFHALCRSVETHVLIARRKYGRLLCGSTLFEDIVKIIATTNTTWGQTVRMTGLLVEHCGVRSADGHAAFPQPSAIAEWTAEALQEECRLGYRAKSIHALASGIVDGSIDLEGIADARKSTAHLLASYAKLPGIGPYGAAHLLAMDGRHDFIAVDTEFRRFVRERYHGGRKVTDATMLRRYAKWGPWKYLAYWSEHWSSER